VDFLGTVTANLLSNTVVSFLKQEDGKKFVEEDEQGLKCVAIQVLIGSFKQNEV